MYEYTVMKAETAFTKQDVLPKSCMSDGRFVMFKLLGNVGTNLTTVNPMSSLL
jgi:hypothetical protein